MDGANCAVSFTPTGELRLQSRGHFLTGGPREKHFTLFKQWAGTHAAALHERLRDRSVMYGEWLYAKHTIFYDALPHYFLEFDVLDGHSGRFLDTPSRRALLAGLPVVSVHVLLDGALRQKRELTDLIGPSQFIRPGHRQRLRDECARLGLDADRVLRETDSSAAMEGLYVKVEEAGAVTGRYKYVRADFLAAVRKSEGHWLNRPIVPNVLASGVELFRS